MPYYRRRRRTPARRYRRRVARRARRGPRVARYMHPAQKLIKLRYVNCFGVPASIAAFSNIRTICANSAWDPDTTGAGYSARGYKFISTYYGHVCVLASKISIKVTTRGADGKPVAHAPFYLMIKRDNDGTYFTGAKDWRTWIMDADTASKFCVNGSEKSFSLSHSFSARKFFGVDDPNDTERLTSIPEAKPADGAFFQIAAESADMQTTLPSLMMQVTVDYICLFTERRDDLNWGAIPDVTEEEVPPVEMAPDVEEPTDLPDFSPPVQP